MTRGWDLTANLWRGLDVHGEEVFGSIFLNSIMKRRVVGRDRGI